MALSQHNWKSTLVFLRKMLKMSVPTAKTWSEFGDVLQYALTKEGERLWATYAIGAKENESWWRANFTDTKIITESQEKGELIIPYSSIKEIGLPHKSVLPARAEYQGQAFLYDTATIRGSDGERYEIKGAAVADGYRDIYLWHYIVRGATLDQARHQQENLASFVAPLST